MRFIILHKTNAHWEAGAIPTPELIGRVQAMIGALAQAHALLGGEGLRASSLGVRLTVKDGRPTLTKGPFKGEHELPAGFSLLRVDSIDQAIDWATRLAQATGDAEIDVRPVTEPWDIGLGHKPAGVTTTRYMALRKATPASEAGTPLPPAQREAVARLIAETTRSGVHLSTVTMKPSARGRRYKNTSDGLRVIDGPFAESKELIAGYVIVSAGSMAEADRWARDYLSVVETDEVDLRELEDVVAADLHPRDVEADL
jgi:hypothetical protein